ncbi:MAG: S41 family peptidase [Candidatus Sulfotelmatobacter sp.]
MRRTTHFVLLSLSLLFAAVVRVPAQQLEQQKIKPDQRDLVEGMLKNLHEALKKNYYDSSFHGLDVDARYKEYTQRIKKAETLGDAFRVVAAYVSGLNDSHTYFVPPRRSYIADYGYRMKMVGDTCYVTEVRPGSDAEQKIHPGDQIVSLDGYAISRGDLWQLDYYLNQIAPKPVTGMAVRSPSGETRRVMIATKYTKREEHSAVAREMDSDFWIQKRERETEQQLMRQRLVEQGDVLFWKMPTFAVEESEVDRMIRIARMHKTLVLDLRGNPGGYVTTLSRLVGSVMDHDVTIATRVMRKGQKPEVAKSRSNNVFTGNLIVLVDSKSASAAELFARVVQLEHRGTVVGDRSSGSVMEALYYPFDDYSGVLVFYGASITSADLIMADGKSLEKVGVTPDVLLLPSAAQLSAGEDPALARAAELAGVKLDPAAAAKLFPFEWAPE